MPPDQYIDPQYQQQPFDPSMVVSLFTESIKNRQTELKRHKESIKKISKIPFENAYVEDCYKFIITYGNNSDLLRKAMQRRNWWIEI